MHRYHRRKAAARSAIRSASCRHYPANRHSLAAPVDDGWSPALPAPPPTLPPARPSLTRNVHSNPHLLPRTPRALFPWVDRSVSVLTEAQDFCLALASLGAQEAGVSAHHRLHKVAGSGTSFEAIVRTNADFFGWRSTSKVPPPADWQPLVSSANLAYLSAVPVRLGDRVAGILVVGFDDLADDHSEYSM